MNQVVAWYIKNNSAFVEMTKSDNVYSSYLRGINKKDKEMKLFSK